MSFFTDSHKVLNKVFNGPRTDDTIINSIFALILEKPIATFEFLQCYDRNCPNHQKLFAKIVSRPKLLTDVINCYIDSRYMYAPMDLILDLCYKHEFRFTDDQVKILAKVANEAKLYQAIDLFNYFYNDDRFKKDITENLSKLKHFLSTFDCLPICEMYGFKIWIYKKMYMEFPELLPKNPRSTPLWDDKEVPSKLKRVE